MFVYVIKVFIL